MADTKPPAPTDELASAAPPPDVLTRENGTTLAYHRTPESGAGGPGVVFYPGFRSDMQGGKALALEARCRADGRAFLRFDYSGHGASSGDFEAGTIGEWAGDAIDALDRLTDGPQVLVGSSMGGWIMLLTALTRPDRVAGMVGIAPAPDFTETVWAEATAEQRQALERDGVWYEPSDYSDEPTPFTMKLIEDGRSHLLLDKPISLDCPVRIIHGMRDPDVPWELSLRLAGQLTSNDVELHFVKSGDHRLSEPHDLARLERVVMALCTAVG